MRRFLKILLLVIVIVVAALAVNAVIVNGETQPATADIGRVIDLPGPDVQVKELGSPDDPAIVLLHCYSCSMKWWEPVAATLSEDHHVILVDLIGHGGSEKPLAGYEIANQAKQVWLALDRVGVDRALLVGHSMGGYVVTAMTEEQPSRVEGLVAVGTPSVSLPSQLPFTAQLGYVPLVGQALKRLAPDSTVRDSLQVAFAPDFPVPDFAVSDFRRLTYSSYDKAGDEAGAYVEAESMPDRLGAFDVPVLYIQGELDALVEPEKTKAGWAEITGARVESLPGDGHSPPLESPDETAALINEFAGEVQTEPEPEPEPKKPEPERKPASKGKDEPKKGSEPKGDAKGGPSKENDKKKDEKTKR